MSAQDRKERANPADYQPNIDGPRTDDAMRDWQKSVADQTAIESKYSQSGLYRNDGSPQLLWPISYISMCQRIYVANDGVHVVAADDLFSTCSDGREFLEIYASGRKIAEHNAVTVLPFVWMRGFVRKWVGYSLPYQKSAGLNDADGVFAIETDQGDRIVFDLATGRVASWRSPWTYYLLVPAGAAPMLVWAGCRSLRGAAGASTARERFWNFTIRDLLAIMSLTAASIVAHNVWGLHASVFFAIAITGALFARLRAGRLSAGLMGAAFALYGAYLTLLGFGFVDSRIFTGYPIAKYLTAEDWKRFVPAGGFLVVSIFSGWWAGRLCSRFATSSMRAKSSFDK